MKGKKKRQSEFDTKKWGFFFLFLIGLIIVLVLFLKPEGEQKARDAIDRARFQNRKAQTIVSRTNTPEDLAKLDLSSDALEKAEALFLESEFTAAIEEASLAIQHAQKIITRDSPSFGAKIRFAELIGDVMVRIQGNRDYEKANNRMELNLADEIRTLTTGGCRLVFSDGLEAILSPSSQMTIQEDLTSAGGKMAIFLESGHLEIKTAELKDRGNLSVITTVGRAHVYPNTAADIFYNSGKRNTTIRVQFGRVDGKSGTQSAIVAQNQQLEFDASSFSEPQDLVPSPQPLSPVRASKFEANKNGFATVALRWEGSSGNRYNVQLSEDPLFVKLVENKLSYGGTRLELPSLKPGNYFWRVFCVGSNGLEGASSQVLQFEVLSDEGKERLTNTAATPPKLKITRQLVQGHMAIIHGSTDRDATVKMNGEMALVNKEDGTFNHVLKLPGFGLHSVDVVVESSSGAIAFKKLSFEVKD
jgi:hypothetical protein